VLGFAGTARATPPITPTAQFTSLLQQAQTLLDQHLQPAYDATEMPVYIGWLAQPVPKGAPDAAKTSVGVTSHSGLHPFIKPYCVIAVYPGNFESTAGTNPSWQEGVILHELFHCWTYEQEWDLLANRYSSEVPEAPFPALPSWVSEGLARWIDLTLFQSDPLPRSRSDLEVYFNEAAQSPWKLADYYAAAGFWAHLQQVTNGGLWSRIQSIIRAAARDGSQAALSAALKGVDQSEFFDTLGSFAANASDTDELWEATSPLPPRDPFSAPDPLFLGPQNGVQTIRLAGAGSKVEEIEVPAPSQPNTIETMSINAGPGGYGLFGVGKDYTAAQLHSLTFCGSATICQQPKTTPCPDDPLPSVPQTLLSPLPDEPLLAVSGSPTGGSVQVRFGAIPTQPVSPCATGGVVGEPHLLDFAGRMFDDMTTGEFTLARSSIGGFDVQARIQPSPLGHGAGPLSSLLGDVSVMTAVAMHVDGHTVEVQTGRSLSGPPRLWIDHRPVKLHSVSLGLGRVIVGAVPTIAGAGRDTVRVTWPDGSQVVVLPAGGYGALDAMVQPGTDLRGHVAGLLGDAGVPATREFTSPSGHRFPAKLVTGISFGKRPARRVLGVVNRFSDDWRLTQHESLFVYPHGKTTRSYHVRGFPRHYLSLGTLPRSRRRLAARSCPARRFRNATLRGACEYDVAVTGEPGFARGDRSVTRTVHGGGAAGPTPPAAHGKPAWVELSSGSDDDDGLVPAVASDGGDVLAAFRSADQSAVTVARYADAVGSHVAATRATAISGWGDVANPRWVGSTLVFSGRDGASLPLSGVDTVAVGSDGMPSAPASLDPGGTLSAGALAPSVGGGPLWTSTLAGGGADLGVTDGSTLNDLSADEPSGTFADDAQLGRDGLGRVWLAWATSGSRSSIQMLQLDPATGAPAAGSSPVTVPQASDEPFALGCTSTCHVVYASASSPGTLESWAPGDGSATTIATGGGGQAVTNPVAASGPGGRLWVGYATGQAVVVKLGSADGSGGKATTLLAPDGGQAELGGAVSTSAGLGLAWNWSTAAGATTVWGTVIPPS
jgi:hypothetical protein